MQKRSKIKFDEFCSAEYCNNMVKENLFLAQITIS